MTTVRNTSCCGMSELVNIAKQKTPEEVLLKTSNSIITQKRSFIIFSCPTQDKIGGELKEYIEKEQLGPVFESEEVVNPNSNNNLRVYMWTVATDAFKKWVEDNKPFRFKPGDRVVITAVLKQENIHMVGMTATVSKYVNNSAIISRTSEIVQDTESVHVLMEEDVITSAQSVRIKPVAPENIQLINPRK